MPLTFFFLESFRPFLTILNKIHPLKYDELYLSPESKILTVASPTPVKNIVTIRFLVLILYLNLGLTESGFGAN